MTADAPTSIGVIGTGNMGSALVRGWLRAKDPGVQLIVWDKIEASMQRLLTLGPISAAGSLEELIGRSAFVLVVIKPKDAPAALKAIAPLMGPGQAVISSMAGVTLEQMRALLGPGPRLFRIMPNLGVELGVGVIAVAAEPGTPDSEIKAVVGLFTVLGVVEPVPESMLDPITAVAGSGPAFLALGIEALEDGAVASGVPRATARRLVRDTALSTARQMPLGLDGPSAVGEVSGASGEATGTQVCEQSGTQAAFRQAIESALERSRRLRHDQPSQR